jgi:hypothetical protein
MARVWCVILDDALLDVNPTAAIVALTDVVDAFPAVRALHVRGSEKSHSESPLNAAPARATHAAPRRAEPRATATATATAPLISSSSWRRCAARAAPPARTGGARAPRSIAPRCAFACADVDAHTPLVARIVVVVVAP